MSEQEVLERIAIAVSRLPFGEHLALPWCRGSFPELDVAMKEWEALEQEKRTEKETNKDINLEVINDPNYSAN
jgi:hypothetical protein